MKVVVLAGGLSPERDVSLSSGSLIANALIKKGYEVMLLDLYLGINNSDFKSIYFNKDSNFVYSYKVGKDEPNLEKLKHKYGDNISPLIG